MEQERELASAAVARMNPNGGVKTRKPRYGRVASHWLGRAMLNFHWSKVFHWTAVKLGSACLCQYF